MEPDLQSLPQSLQSSRKWANFQHISKLLIVCGTWAMKQLFDKLCPPVLLHRILENRQILIKFKSSNLGFSRADLKCLYPDEGEATSANFDLLLLYKLLTPRGLNLFGLKAIADKEVMEDLKTFRDLRNKLAHTVTLEIDEEEYSRLLPEVRDILERLAHVVGGCAMVTEMNSKFKKLLEEEIDTSNEGHIFMELQAYFKNEIEVINTENCKHFEHRIEATVQAIADNLEDKVEATCTGRLEPLTRDIENLKASVDNMRLSVTAQNSGSTTVGSPDHVEIEEKKKKVMEDIISGGKESLKSGVFSGANDNQYVALMAREVHEGKQIKATSLAGAEEGDSESEDEDENAGSSSFNNLDPQDDSQTENTLGGAEGSEDAVEEFKAQHLPTAVEDGAQGPEGAATRHNDLIVRDENENKTAVTGRSKLPPGARPKERVYKKPRGNVPTSKGTQKVLDWCYKYLEERESQCEDELKTIENLKTVAASELKKTIGGAHTQSAMQPGQKGHSQSAVRPGQEGHTQSAVRPGQEGHTQSAVRLGQEGHTRSAVRPGQEGHSQSAVRLVQEGHTQSAVRPGQEGHTQSSVRPGKEGLLNWSYDDYERMTNNFDEDHHIDSGGQGEVFYGEHNGLKLAIKRVFKPSTVRREKRISSYRHPFLLPVWDVCEDERKPSLIVYPYMSEGNLFRKVVGAKEGEKIPYQRRIAIALNCAYALKHLHEKGNIYFDFKSRNILLDEELNPRLGDYGQVKFLRDCDASAGQTGGETSTSRVSMHTAGYVDPIYKELGDQDNRYDLWGLGIVMLELLTGQSGSNKEGISLPYREPMKLFKALGVQRPQFACEAARILYNNDQVGHWIKEEGWPTTDSYRNITRNFATLALSCLHRSDLDQRMPLEDLCQHLKVLAEEANMTPLFVEPDTSVCLYCLREPKGHITMDCVAKHWVACLECLCNVDSLLCPYCCLEQYCLVGNPWSYALCVAGAGNFDRKTKKALDTQVLKKDADDFAKVLKDKKFLGFREDQVHCLTDSSATQTEIRRVLREIKDAFSKIRTCDDTNRREGDKKLTLFVFLSGHFDTEDGCGYMKLTASTCLRGVDFLRRLRQVDADNTIIILNGCNAEAFIESNESNNNVFATSSAKTELPRSVEDVFRTGPLESLGSGCTGSSNSTSLAEMTLPSQSPVLQSLRKCPAPPRSSLSMFKNNAVAFCACRRDEIAQFPDPALVGRVDNSYFVRFLLNGIQGGKKCFNPSKNAMAEPCGICWAYQKKLSSLICMELSDLVNYVRQHMEKFQLPEPRYVYHGDGRKLKIAFMKKSQDS